MKNKLIVILCLICSIGYAQVGIGTTEPNASAVLELSSSNSGFLLTRVALTSLTDITTIPNPVEGLMVYSPTSNSANLTPGVYVFDGTRWGRVSLDYSNNNGPSQTYARLIKDEIGVNNVVFSSIYSNSNYGAFSSLFDDIDNTSSASFHANRIGSAPSNADWGFGIQLPQAYTIKQLVLDGRNDCCTARIQNIVVQLYYSGNLVHTTSPITSVSSGKNYVNIPDVEADEMRFVVPNGGPTGNGYSINFSELEVVAED